MKLTNKQFLILVIVIVFFFVSMGYLTYLIGGKQDTTDDDKDKIEDTRTKDDEEKKSKSDEGEKFKSDKPENSAAKDTVEDDPFKELDELIGLESVKREVHELADFVKVQKMREERGLKMPKMSYHLVFTGNPGTGKTTVARIVARIYRDLGVIKGGHTVETDRSGLVAEYVGQTAIKTNHIIDSALNGVLFIDEAYTLVPDGGHGGDYGLEAIATLLKRMEDDRDKLVVIIAGYTNEMNTFINSNPGLQSRFNKYIDFPDYKPDELLGIFKLHLKKNEYVIDEETTDFLREKLEQVVARGDRNFGNGRYVRNVFEKAVQNHASRIVDIKNPSSEVLKKITKEDLEKAFADMK